MEKAVRIDLIPNNEIGLPTEKALSPRDSTLLEFREPPRVKERNQHH